jgi:ornithine--oxo-acid transaminase
MGRTGKLLACEHEGVRPDGLILGKGLGGGLLPVSLFLARRDVMGVFGPGDHGSTFGGNPLACAIGLAALDLLVEGGLPGHAAESGEYFIARLSAGFALCQEVRGGAVDRWKSIVAHCRRNSGEPSGQGVLTRHVHETVLRCAAAHHQPAADRPRADGDWAAFILE